jgi:hypothetical protein
MTNAQQAIMAPKLTFALLRSFMNLSLQAEAKGNP